MIKRTFDLIVSLLGVVILAPVFLIIAILIKKDSKGDVFFRGVRIGRNGEPFKIYKFRSMIQNCEGKGKWNIGDHDERITKVGRFLRKSKLDELPQLFNVLTGKMSFVGPRPELKYYVDMYTEKEKSILDLRPGITDWASMVNFEQFKGFTTAKDPDLYYIDKVRPLKLQLQLYYRHNHCLKDDAICVLWTIYKVITHSKKLPPNIQAIMENNSNKENAKCEVQ